MTGKRLMIGSAAIAVAALVSVSGASAFDGHRGGGGGHVRGEGARMGSGFSGVHVASPGQGASSVATGRTMAGQGYAGRYASGLARGYGATTGRAVAGQAYAGRYAGGYGRYGYGRYGYGALGAGIGLGPAGWGWGYPGYAYSSGYDGYPGYAYASGYDWGYPGYASTWGAGNCTCGGHFTSGTAGAW
jgi:hypothetical protein